MSDEEKLQQAKGEAGEPCWPARILLLAAAVVAVAGVLPLLL